jgi:cell division protein FtsB
MRRRAFQYGFLFVGCVLIVNSLVGEKGLFAMLRAREQYSELEDSLGQIRGRNAVLREQARRLREDPSAIEEVAREDLGFIRKGEKVFVVRDAAPAKLPAK